MHTKIDSMCEQWWPPKQHLGKISEQCCTCCVTKDHWELSTCNRTQITCVSGKATTYITSRHFQAWLLWCRERVDWRVEWCSVAFSDESRFCLYVIDGLTRVRCRSAEHHLLECIRPRHRHPTSGLMVWGTISYNSRSYLVFL